MSRVLDDGRVIEYMAAVARITALPDDHSIGMGSVAGGNSECLRVE